MEKTVILLFVIGCKAFILNERLPISWYYPFEFNYAAFCGHYSAHQNHVPLYMAMPHQLLRRSLYYIGASHFQHPSQSKLLETNTCKGSGCNSVQTQKYEDSWLEATEQNTNPSNQEQIILQTPTIYLNQGMTSSRQNQVSSNQDLIVLRNSKVYSIQKTTSSNRNLISSTQNLTDLPKPKIDSIQTMTSSNQNKTSLNEDNDVIRNPKIHPIKNEATSKESKNSLNSTPNVLPKPKIHSIKNITYVNHNNTSSDEENIISRKANAHLIQNITSPNQKKTSPNKDDVLIKPKINPIENVTTSKQNKNSSNHGSKVVKKLKIRPIENITYLNQNENSSDSDYIVFQKSRIDPVQDIRPLKQTKKSANQETIVQLKPKIHPILNIAFIKESKNSSDQHNIVSQKPEIHPIKNMTTSNQNNNSSDQSDIVSQKPEIHPIKNMTTSNQNNNSSDQSDIVLQKSPNQTLQNITSLNENQNHQDNQYSLLYSSKQSNISSKIIFPWSNPAKASSNRSVCLTKACNETAARIIDYINPEVHPCTDFYEYSCGDFLKRPLPSDQNVVGSLNRLQNEVDEQLIKFLSENTRKSDPKPFHKMRTYYMSCMDTATIDARGLDHVKTLLQRAGGWPVLHEKWDPLYWNPIETEIKLEKLFHFKGVFMEVGVSPDLNNSSRKIVAIDQPNDLGLNMDLLLLGREDKMVKAHFRYMVDIAVFFGAPKRRAVLQMYEALKLSIDIAKICSDRLSRVNLNRMKNYFTLGTLKIRWKWMDWDRLFSRLLPMGLHLPEDHEVLVTEQDYITNLELVLRNYTEDAIANFMMFITVKRLTSMLPKKLREMQFDIEDIVGAPYTSYPRNTLCLEYTKEIFSEALAALYVRRSVGKRSLHKLKAMVDRIRLQMVDHIMQVSWMDKKTKKQAKEKASSIIEVIGYPGELTDDHEIEEFYVEMSSLGHHFLENTLLVKEWQNVVTWKSVVEVVNKIDWRDFANQIIKVNAFYDPFKNMIAIPAAILNLPFFHTDVPWYLNYAAVGNIIGHEITHGFDNEGRKFDAQGRHFDWWDEESEKNFIKQKQCFVEQYSAFNDTKNTKLMLNGQNTEGENIADNGGLKLTYRAYKKHITKDEPSLAGLEQFSQDQLFFLSMANMWCTKKDMESLKNVITMDYHSPEEFRVTGMLQNFPEFSKAFGCNANQRMNPDKKCNVWGSQGSF